MIRSWGDLDIVAKVEDDALCYEWHTVAILRREVNGYYQYAVYDESGCSCSYEFEGTPNEADYEWSESLAEVAVKARASVTFGIDGKMIMNSQVQKYRSGLK